jgi:hypothetical protein
MKRNYLEPNQKLEYDKERHDYHWNTYKDFGRGEFPALNSLRMPEYYEKLIIDSTKQGDAFPTFEEQFTPTAQDSGNWELDNGAIAMNSGSQMVVYMYLKIYVNLVLLIP